MQFIITGTFRSHSRYRFRRSRVRTLRQKRDTVQKRLSCKYIAKLIAICDGIQIYPVYSAEPCRTTFYPICFRYVDERSFWSTSELFHFVPPSSFCILFLSVGIVYFCATPRRARHRFSEQKLRLSIFFSVPVTSFPRTRRNCERTKIFCNLISSYVVMCVLMVLFPFFLSF